MWLWAFFRPVRRGGTTKRPFLKIPGAPARRGNASRELAKKEPVFEKFLAPLRGAPGTSRELVFSPSRPPSVFRLPDPVRMDFVAAGAKNPGLPNGEILYDRLKMAAIRRMGFLPKVERSM